MSRLNGIKINAVCHHLISLQIMGPKDSYLLQYSSDVNSFWAENSALELGATFNAKGTPPKTRIPKVHHEGQIQPLDPIEIAYCWSQHLSSSSIGALPWSGVQK